MTSAEIKKLRKICMGFSMRLHGLEEKGMDIPQEVDKAWELLTVWMEETKGLVKK